MTEALSDIVAQARTAWPAIWLADEVFLPYLARRVAMDGDGRPLLSRLAARDLYLACACALGDEAAIAVLKAQYFPKVRAALHGMGLSSAQADDIEQALCVRLLVRTPESTPHIERYSGRGELPCWLCIVAVREARLALRKEQRDPVLSEDVLLQLIGADAGSELGYLKQQYRGQFRSAFRAAVAALSARERNVLRCHLLGGMSNAQIGALCGVHPGTVKRWMAEIRDSLLGQTREALRHRLGLSPTEVDSVIRLIRSDLDVSIEMMLEDDR